MGQYAHKLKSCDICSICYRTVFFRIILMKSIKSIGKFYISLNSYFIIEAMFKKSLFNIELIRNGKCNLQINARFLNSLIKRCIKLWYIQISN